MSWLETLAELAGALAMMTVFFRIAQRAEDGKELGSGWRDAAKWAAGFALMGLLAKAADRIADTYQATSWIERALVGFAAWAAIGAGLIVALLAFGRIRRALRRKGRKDA